jgi:diguanylate cyclase (GGDEF)-like protein
MTIAKLRAALLVFFVGFALGLSVFAASRLFVRSVLSADATTTAEELAYRLAEQNPVEASGTLSTVIRYTRFDAAGRVVETVDLAARAQRQPSAISDADMRLSAQMASHGSVVVAQSPLLPSLLGLSEPAVRGVAVPLPGTDEPGTLFVEIDQAQALQSLTRAFSVIGMVTVGLAVLAIIAIGFVVRRRGFADEKKPFDPKALPRDPLTSLPTRAGFRDALADAVERATAADQPVALLVIDLGGVRAVNDVWGHAAGDAVLKLVGERLQGFSESPAGLARISGTEFALILEREATSHSLRRLAERIRETACAPYPVAGSTMMLSARMGAAMFPVNGDSAEILFRAADTALSKAKSEGRTDVAFFDTDMQQRMGRRAALERDLAQALEREEFVLFYQPQLELASGRLRGYEALVRWERPGEGIVAPRDFLSVAEETGLIGPLGEWVLRKACRDAASWLDSGTVAVNFSATQFRFPDLHQTIAKVLAETGLPPERLEVEVPEGLFLQPGPDVMDTLHRIKALGVRVAMDDFGAGYSGLTSLARFPFDKVKIDKSFVGRLTDDPEIAAIVAAIVGLGRSLSVDITAEGVETTEQVTLLKAAGCSIVQGFLFGMPQRTASAPAAGPQAEARHG